MPTSLAGTNPGQARQDGQANTVWFGDKAPFARLKTGQYSTQLASAFTRLWANSIKSAVVLTKSDLNSVKSSPFPVKPAENSIESVATLAKSRTKLINRNPTAVGFSRFMIKLARFWAGFGRFTAWAGDLRDGNGDNGGDNNVRAWQGRKARQTQGRLGGLRIIITSCSTLVS